MHLPSCFSGSPSGLPVAASHSRAVLLRAGRGDFVPSGLKATASTLSSCFSGAPSGLPVAASHSRAVLSELAVAIFVPSGLKATALH